MPGPTSKGTYIGRSLGATLAAVAEKKAARHELDDPRCRVCNRPMTCGQDRLNRGAHFVCAPPSS